MKCVGSVRRDGFFMDIVVWAGQVMFAGPETSHFGRGEGGGEVAERRKRKTGNTLWWAECNLGKDAFAKEPTTVLTSCVRQEMLRCTLAFNVLYILR